jgi:hypothetical protein
MRGQTRAACRATTYLSRLSRQPKCCPLVLENLPLRRLMPLEVVWRPSGPPAHYRPIVCVRMPPSSNHCAMAHQRVRARGFSRGRGRDPHPQNGLLARRTEGTRKIFLHKIYGLAKGVNESVVHQKATSSRAPIALFDHLVGAGEYCRRKCKAQCLRGFKIDHRLIPAACVIVDQIRPKGDQAARSDEEAFPIDRWQLVPGAGGRGPDRVASAEEKGRQWRPRFEKLKVLSSQGMKLAPAA